MPIKSRRSNKIRNKVRKTRKNPYPMIGCSKKHSHNKNCYNKNNKKNIFSSLGKKSCPNCGPNCHCKGKCNCPPNCPGTCYVKKGGSGCGSCGCPIAPLSWNQMNQFGGNVNYGESQYPPILGTGQNGGTCATCSQIPVISPTQSGGNFFKPASPIPGPFVGQAWNTSINQWPGMDGIGANRNYFSSIGKVINNDPALQMMTSDADAGYTTLNSMVGGYEYQTKKKEDNKKKKAKRRTTNTRTTNTRTSSNVSSKSMSNKNSISSGGGLVPQDLLNLGNDISFNVKSAYNALNGYSAPVNPLPYKDQLTR
jgi:hypothetical protein